MASTFIKSEEHPLALSAVYVQDLGKLTDNFHKLEYEIIDDSSSFGGSTLVSKTDVTSVSGAKLGTGRYGAYDTNTNAPWKPSSTVARGRVKWYLTWSSGEAPVIYQRRFEVLDPSTTDEPTQGLILSQDYKDALSGSASKSDRQIHIIIQMWTDIVQRYTRQRFLPHFEEHRLRWRPGKSIKLQEPVFGLDRLRVVGEAQNKDLPDWLVFGATGSERRNPRIEPDSGDIPGWGWERKKYMLVRGVWGFLNENTLGPPLALRDITTEALAAIEKSTTSGTGFTVGPIQREETDGHEVEYAVGQQQTRTGLMALIEVPRFRDVMDLYRAPIAGGMVGA